MSSENAIPHKKKRSDNTIHKKKDVWEYHSEKKRRALKIPLKNENSIHKKRRNLKIPFTKKKKSGQKIPFTKKNWKYHSLKKRRGLKIPFTKKRNGQKIP